MCILPLKIGTLYSMQDQKKALENQSPTLKGIKRSPSASSSSLPGWTKKLTCAATRTLIPHIAQKTKYSKQAPVRTGQIGSSWQRVYNPNSGNFSKRRYEYEIWQWPSGKITHKPTGKILEEVFIKETLHPKLQPQDYTYGYDITMKRKGALGTWEIPLKRFDPAGNFIIQQWDLLSQAMLSGQIILQ